MLPQDSSEVDPKYIRILHPNAHQDPVPPENRGYFPAAGRFERSRRDGLGRWNASSGLVLSKASFCRTVEDPRRKTGVPFATSDDLASVPDQKSTVPFT
jgi:hypothetical protein